MFLFEIYTVRLAHNDIPRDPTFIVISNMFPFNAYTSVCMIQIGSHSIMLRSYGTLPWKIRISFFCLSFFLSFFLCVALLFFRLASKPQKSSTQPVYSTGLGYMPLLTAMFPLRYVFRTSVRNGILIKTVLHYTLVFHFPCSVQQF